MAGRTVRACPDCDRTYIWKSKDSWRCKSCGPFDEPVERPPKQSDADYSHLNAALAADPDDYP